MVSDDPAFFEKTVILFENEEYIVKTNFVTFITAYPFNVLTEYEVTKEKAMIDILNADTLNMIRYVHKGNDRIFTLAHHLETGNCFLYHKKIRINNKFNSNRRISRRRTYAAQIRQAFLRQRRIISGNR